MDARRCLECGRLVGKDVRRGLCRTCYRDPEVRDGYEPLPRGAWSRRGFAPRDVVAKAVVADLHEAGLSDREIAQQTGRSVAAVTKERQRMGLAVSRERQAASKVRAWKRKRRYSYRSTRATG